MIFFKNNASLEIIKGLLSEYDIQSAEDMEEVPKGSSWRNH